jgi:hypothetical protein
MDRTQLTGRELRWHRYDPTGRSNVHDANLLPARILIIGPAVTAVSSQPGTIRHKSPHDDTDHKTPPQTIRRREKGCHLLPARGHISGCPVAKTLRVKG